jgi:hypothetical protein
VYLFCNEKDCLIPYAFYESLAEMIELVQVIYVL